jgi:hypothetical protein
VINWLTAATKRRVIEELRKILYDHPKYREDSQNVLNKYSFKERPSRGIIVMNTSADHVRLSSSNYIGRLSSFCMLTPFRNAPGTTLEWVRENFPVLEQYSPDRTVFPTPPGVYIVQVKSLPDPASGMPGKFTVLPHLTVNNEQLLLLSMFGGVENCQGTGLSVVGYEAQLSNGPLYPGALRLWLYGRRPLLADVDYVVDDDGLITFLKQLPDDATVYADYRYVLPEQGPYDFNYESVNVDAIPGTILAFGDRAQDCDRMAVVITEDRVHVADIYGGKFEVHFDLTVFARDPEDREKMSDYVVIKVLELQNAIGFEGLELLDISPGGESEEAYNAETDEYYYESSISMTLRVDWAIHVPLPVQNFRIEMTSKSEEQQRGFADGTYTLDMLNMGEPIDVAGVSITIGKGLSYSRVT